MLRVDKPAEVLFILSGSIACYKACQTISRLRADGYAVQVVATQAALRFVGAATLEGLTGRAVASDLYAAGSMMDHIHLIRRADIAVVAPASANFINKMAAGIADDLASTLFLAHRFDKPFLVAPAMNTAMYQHPVTQAAMTRLQAMGVTFLQSEAGRLACGEEGEGRLLQPEALLREIESHLATNSPLSTTNAMKPRGRVVVTAGGTQEPVDAVRVLSNSSTGTTGAALARHFAAQGFAVTLLLAKNSHADTAGIDYVQRFGSFVQLDEAMRHALADPACIAFVHAAAVSDYSVIDADSQHKHASDADEWTLRLKRNPKLIDAVRKSAVNSDLLLIGFKLTANATHAEAERAVQNLIAHSKADYVVHNDIAEIKTGKHPFHVYSKQGDRSDCVDLSALALHLTGLFESHLPHQPRAKHGEQEQN